MWPRRVSLIVNRRVAAGAVADPVLAHHLPELAGRLWADLRHRDRAIREVAAETLAGWKQIGED